MRRSAGSLNSTRAIEARRPSDAALYMRRGRLLYRGRTVPPGAERLGRRRSSWTATGRRRSDARSPGCRRQYSMAADTDLYNPLRSSALGSIYNLRPCITEPRRNMRPDGEAGRLLGTGDRAPERRTDRIGAPILTKLRRNPPIDLHGRDWPAPDGARRTADG